VLARSPFPHSADGEAEEVEALVNMDDAGFLFGEPQPQRGQDGGCLLAQRLSVLAGAVHHDDKVIGLCRLRDYADLRAEAAGGGTKCGSDVGIIRAP
jgi:hypothetical protein